MDRAHAVQTPPYGQSVDPNIDHSNVSGDVSLSAANDAVMPDRFDNGLGVTRVSGFVLRGMLGDESVAAPVPKQTCAILLPTQQSKWCNFN